MPPRPDDQDVAANPLPRHQLFGRSKGKALRAKQAGRIEQALPGLTIDPESIANNPAALFSPPVQEVHLEIGFGGGEHLAAMARASPVIGFLGVEPFLNGVAKLLAAIEADQLANIRILRGDARDLLDILPEASLSRVYLLYPDPWPKRRQRKRRIVDAAFLAHIARVLIPGGDLCFATDIDDYAGWVLARIAQQTALHWLAETADDWRKPWDGWHPTRYEQKALREGRLPGYFRFLKG